MQRVRRALREHLHFIVVTTVLTLVMTFPTIVYVFRMDVFWLPVGDSNDVFFAFWDSWHIKRVLSGQAELFYTSSLFYPQGLPLVYQSFFLPHAITINVLQILMPVSNAFSLAFLLILFSSALSAYVYLLYIFGDKWTALFGATVFGLSPHTIGNASHPVLSYAAPIPLVLYFFHRGVQERRSRLIAISGALAGLTCATGLYTFVCLIITLGIVICAFAWSRWRDRGYWLNVGLLTLVICFASAWRILPMMDASQSLSDALAWHGTGEGKNDLISFFVNHDHPLSGPLLDSLLLTPADAKLSQTSYLGLLPLMLIGIGLGSRRTRRSMLPWFAVGGVFFILRLGSTLRINGMEYPGILLPKHFIDEVLPFAFSAFSQTDLFMLGILTPLAVTSCFGLMALLRMRLTAKKRVFVLLLIGILAFEYYVPIKEKIYPNEQFAFLDWLAREDNFEEIRLINLPMGRKNSKRYGLYQTLSGYPHAEGATNRTPPASYIYIGQNHLLSKWSEKQSVSCDSIGQGTYLAELTRLEDDGFSHVVHHHRWAIDSTLVADSFRNASPSYSDDFVSIYRMTDLLTSCAD